MASSSKRCGQHGTFRKSHEYITSCSKRITQEKSYLKTMTRVVGEMKTKTKTPCVFLAISGGKLVASASTPELEKFLNNNIVTEEFLSCCALSTDVGGNSDVEEEEELKDSAPYEEKDYDFPHNWSSMTVHEKRKLVCQIVSWTNKCKTINWATSDAPTWWPSNVKFQSPHSKKGEDRAKNNALNTIVEAFLDFQGKQSIFELQNGASQSLSAMCNMPLEELERFCNEKCQEIAPFINFLNFSQYATDVDCLHICLSCKVPSSTSRKPMREVKCYAEAISLSLFHTSEKKDLVKLLSFIYNVAHIEKVSNMLQNGWIGRTSSSLKEELKIQDLNYDTLKTHVVQSTTAENSDMLCLFGAFNIMQLKMDLVLCDDIDFTHFDGSSNNIIQLIFEENFIIPLVNVSNAERLSKVCGMNPLCNNSEDTSLFQCSFCCLEYHNGCVFPDDNMSCGCHLLSQLHDELKLLQDCKIVTNILSTKSGPLFNYIGDIVHLRTNLTRVDLIKNISSPDCAVRLERVNDAYHKLVPENCKRVLYIMTEHVLTLKKNAGDVAINFPNIDQKKLAHEVLFPEVCKRIIQYFGSIEEVNDLTVERFIYRAVK